MGLEMNADQISVLMKNQIVEIQFEHYRTGETLKTRGTLDPAYTGRNVIEHNPASEIIAFWDVDESNWKSLYVNTIKGVEAQ